MVITRRAVLAEAATISIYRGQEIVAAVRDASVDQFREWAKYAYVDGKRGEALAHEVAVQLAMAAGVEW